MRGDKQMNRIRRIWDVIDNMPWLTQRSPLRLLKGEQSPLKNSKTLTWKAFRWYLVEIFPQEVREGDRLRQETWKQARKSFRYQGGKADFSLYAETGQGKVTDCGNDRFRCIYTRIPSNRDFQIEAEVTVESFLHEPGPNCHESFGIFVRDSLEPDPYTGEYYSNMAALGGYYGRYNFFGRTGISPDSIENVKNFFLYPRIDDDKGMFVQKPLFYRICPEHPVRMRLALQKRGSKITARMTDQEGNDLLSPASNGGEGEIAKGGNVLICEDGYSVSLPEAFSTRDPAWIYVGFEVADGSGFLVHKDSLRVTLTGMEDKTSMERGIPLKTFRGKTASQKRKATHVWENNPEVCRSNDSEKNSKGDTWIVAVDGTSGGNGTETSPMDLLTAIKQCRPGDTVFVKTGTYRLNSSVCLEKAESGGSGYRRILKGENDHTVFDFQGMANALVIHGNGWLIDGISVTRGHGIKIEGNYNIIRNCRTYRNLETGILIRHPDLSSSRDEWPRRNIVENCVSYENRDRSECNADGFACKVAAGDGNRFRNCIAFLNTDDGFDLFTKNRTIGSVTIEQCQSYLNGYRLGENGRLVATAGNGNGFKLGGSGLAVRHKVKECISAGNKRHGFSSNSNPIMVLDQCTAYQNGQQNCNYFFYAAETITPEKSFCDCNFENRSEFDAEVVQKELLDRYSQ